MHVLVHLYAFMNSEGCNMFEKSTGQMWKRSQQKLLRLADEEGSSLSACADVLRSSLNILINFSSFESCTWFLVYGTLVQRNVCSQLCSVRFSSVVTFAFPVFLQITYIY